jgi:hypothetical protein
VPHPIAAGNRLEGQDCQGWRLAPSLATAKLPLTGLPWRATQSGADEAPAPMTQRPRYLLTTGHAVPLAARKPRGMRVHRVLRCAGDRPSRGLGLLGAAPLPHADRTPDHLLGLAGGGCAHVTYSARLLLTAPHPSDHGFQERTCRPGHGWLSHQISSDTIAARLYTVSTRPPCHLHTIRLRSVITPYRPAYL